MCGFVGFTNKINDASIVLGKMMDRIKHRGPDSDGKYVDEQIAMGFRRLSIIDLSDQGSQPIFNEDKSLVLTFNSEIYNYKDLREELVASGHKFYTQTDSEVLIHGYEQWGEDMLDKLRGMFAFVIFNKNTNEVFGARDFFGIKPLYYAKMCETLMWGSLISRRSLTQTFLKLISHSSILLQQKLSSKMFTSSLPLTALHTRTAR